MNSLVLFIFYDYLNKYIGKYYIIVLSLQTKSFEAWILKHV